MATLLEISLPDGWKELTSEPSRNLTRVGRPGRWTFIDNDDYAIWKFGVNYLRSDYETSASKRIDTLHNFFLKAASNAFLVTDPADSTDSDRDGAGLIVQVNGVWRLVKRYGASGYQHPITRPTSVVLSAGTLGALGTVTGISSPGTWTGTFSRPCVFQENGLKLQISPDGTVAAVDVALEEQLEI